MELSLRVLSIHRLLFWVVGVEVLMLVVWMRELLQTRAMVAFPPP